MPLNSKNLPKILVTGTLLLALAGLAGFCYSTFLKLNYTYTTNLGEAPLSQTSALLGAGKAVYRDLKTPPYSLVPYGPVYIGINAVLQKVLPGPFLSGRLLSLAALFLICFLVYALLRQAGAAREICWIMPLFLLAHPYIERWGPQVVVDVLGVALNLAAFYFFQRFISENYRKKDWLISGIVFATFAFFTKSSMVSAPAALFIYLMFKREYKRAFLFAGILGTIILAIYATLFWLTAGNYYFCTAYEISRRLFFYQFIGRFWLAAAKMAPLLIVSTAWILYRLLAKKEIHYFHIFVVIGLLLTFSLGKQGSETNYLLEWVVSATIACGLLVTRQTAKSMWILGAIFCQLAVWVLPYAHFKEMKTYYDEREVFYDKISLLIRQTKGIVLSEDMGLLLTSGKEIYYEPFPMGQMSYSGVWDESLILKELDEQKFSLAILYFYAPKLRQSRTFTSAFMKKFNEKYEYVVRAEPPHEPLQTLYFYRPKKQAMEAV